MAKIKTKGRKVAEVRHPVTFHLSPGELAAMDAALKAMPGIEPTRAAYARNAVLMYPRLRKLHERIADIVAEERKDVSLEDVISEVGL